MVIVLLSNIQIKLLFYSSTDVSIKNALFFHVAARKSSR